MNRINIFCLPFAGGNKYSYRYYETASPPFLSFTTIEYPGRGSRARESLISTIDTLVDDLYSQIIERINGSDYALYGHSMGGLAAYLLTRKLIENKKKPPLHLFISGITGPSSRAIQKNKKHRLNKAEITL
jgi:surfactin synthase thioesterase subunit